MIIVHVDDVLLATNNSHQAESHISRLLGKYDIKDVKRADADGGVSLLWKTSLDCAGRNETGIGCLALQQDQTEFVKARCEPARMSRVRARQEGVQCTTGEIREMRSMTGSLHLVTGGTRPDESSRVSRRGNNQRPWCPITSVPYKP